MTVAVDEVRAYDELPGRTADHPARKRKSKSTGRKKEIILKLSVV